jgi:hypothetical protein
MPANTSPIFTLTPHVSWGTVDDNAAATAGPMLTANANMNGTSYVTPVFTAGANGSYLQRLIARPMGTNIATVLRIFLNNGLTNATPGNNALIGEVTLPATTANAAAALQSIEFALNFPIPAGYVINCTLGTAVAAGYMVTMVGGDY